MIRVGEHTFFLLAPDGRSVPFDPAVLQERIASALGGGTDPKDAFVARDITSAVELALASRKNGPEDSSCFKAEALDELVVRILNGAGYRSAAEKFRREAIRNGDFVRIPLDRIRSFIEENLSLSGEMLDRIAEKVFHTMKSIGADDSSPGLVLELARHFLSAAAGGVRFNIEQPDFTPDKECTIKSSELEAALPDEARSFFEKRILRVHPVNLRILPALRIDVRLTGIAEREALSAPLTELALAPGFIRAARAADALCLAADGLFRAHGNLADLPAKVLLNLADASVFTREWMGCNSVESQEKCAVALCRAFACEMTRVPFRQTCN